MRKIFTSFLILLLSFTVLGEKKAEKLNIGLVMSTGGLGSGFNRMAYDALEELKENGTIESYKYIEPNNVSEDYQFLDDFSGKENFDLIIGMGSVVAESLKEIQKKYPNQKYALVGGSPQIPNTTTINFKEHEAAYLAGALAAMVSKTKIIGIIPAMDNKSFNKFTNGYTAGAKYVDKDIKVLVAYMPTSSANPFSDPVTGKNIADSLNDRGADVILHVAEGTGSGVFESAKNRGYFAIGCDEDEDFKIPRTILTSVRVRIDNAVVTLVENLKKGEFVSGHVLADLKTKGVSLTDFKYTKEQIGKNNLLKLEKIKEEILNGKIVVKE